MQRFPFNYWEHLLSNNQYFNSRGNSLHDIAFWRQNLLIFGSISILFILGLGNLTATFENAGMALKNRRVMNRVYTALAERESLDEYALSQLVQNPSAQPSALIEISQMENEIISRIQVLRQWRYLLQNREELVAYITAMATSGIEGCQIWEYALNREEQPTTPTHNQVPDNPHAGVSLCIICAEDNRNNRFAFLPCCGRVGGSNYIHNACISKCACCDRSVGRGKVKCPFCRNIVSLSTVGFLDVLTDSKAEAKSRGNEFDQQQNPLAIDWDPNLPCTSGQAAQRSQHRAATSSANKDSRAVYFAALLVKLSPVMTGENSSPESAMNTQGNALAQHFANAAAHSPFSGPLRHRRVAKIQCPTPQTASRRFDSQLPTATTLTVQETTAADSVPTNRTPTLTWIRGSLGQMRTARLAEETSINGNGPELVHMFWRRRSRGRVGPPNDGGNNGQRQEIRIDQFLFEQSPTDFLEYDDAYEEDT